MRFLNGRCGSFFVFVMLLRLKREFFQMKRFFPRLKRFWASIKMSSSRWSQRRHSGSHRKTQASCSMISIRRCRRASQVMNDAHACRPLFGAICTPSRLSFYQDRLGTRIHRESTQHAEPCVQRLLWRYRCEKRHLFWVFPMFVPSLSWQNDRFYI